MPAERDDLVGIDLFDRDALIAFARDWRPEAILHIATAIPPDLRPRRAVEQFEATNRLRTEGTGNLVAAAESAGSAWLVSQSVAFMSRPGPGLAGDDDPLRTQPGDVMEPIAGPQAELERLTLDAGGNVLRFGQFYGPGTTYADDGGLGSAAAAGKLPILTRGGVSSVFSFVHVDDAADATIAALEHGGSGVYNITDDEPAAAREWMPAFAEAAGARPPRSIPVWLGKLLGGPLVGQMATMRGASNEAAKRELGWAPAHPSWREGFQETLRSR